MKIITDHEEIEKLRQPCNVYATFQFIQGATMLKDYILENEPY